jgi:hypothetical protein
LMLEMEGDRGDGREGSQVRKVPVELTEGTGERLTEGDGRGDNEGIGAREGAPEREVV